LRLGQCQLGSPSAMCLHTWLTLLSPEELTTSQGPPVALRSFI
jgi:hypothetical protein